MSLLASREDNGARPCPSTVKSAANFAVDFTVIVVDRFFSFRPRWEMITVLKAHDRANVPSLFAQMFEDRAMVFHDRLRWEIEVKDGLESDYLDDTAQPTYIVEVDDEGRVAGSLRILPTNGDIILKSAYGTQFALDPTVFDATVWECSRFYVKAGRIQNSLNPISSRLLISLCEFSLSQGIEAIIGFFDRPMLRVYQRIGWTPSIIARSNVEGKSVVGKWNVSSLALESMRSRLNSSSNDARPIGRTRGSP